MSNINHQESNRKTESKNSTETKNIVHRANLGGVLVAAMDKGQLPLMTVALIFILLVLRLDSDKANDLINKIIDGFIKLHLLGWFLFVVVVFLWIWTNSRQKDTHKIEMDRISLEKKDLQDKLLLKDLPTSKKKKN